MLAKKINLKNVVSIQFQQRKTNVFRQERNSFSLFACMIWYDLICDMIFIYCIWISTRLQWSVNLYESGTVTAIYKRKNNTENNTKT
jgi:hypothetical protein